MRGLTGALADGWFQWVYSPDAYEADLRRVLQVAEERGRDAGAIDRAVMVPTAVTDDADEARSVEIERNRTTLALRPGLLSQMGTRTSRRRPRSCGRWSSTGSRGDVYSVDAR